MLLQGKKREAKIRQKRDVHFFNLSLHASFALFPLNQKFSVERTQGSQREGLAIKFLSSGGSLICSSQDLTLSIRA